MLGCTASLTSSSGSKPSWNVCGTDAGPSAAAPDVAGSSANAGLARAVPELESTTSVISPARARPPRVTGQQRRGRFSLYDHEQQNLYWQGSWVAGGCRTVLVELVEEVPSSRRRRTARPGAFDRRICGHLHGAGHPKALTCPGRVPLACACPRTTAVLAAIPAPVMLVRLSIVRGRARAVMSYSGDGKSAKSTAQSRGLH
eukprot:scaffold1518_cov417-Prasinococcus_capsulatus_cf.AAC.7